MPSSITLTVSHLPTSLSFFLSALQPLEYGFRGRSNNTIGFGSTTNPSAPPDFWITQEIPGVPAGAAHIAFQAHSRMAVERFFKAALTAGGKIHGEPAVRDGGGYYSAAVIDFDGNSIEAVFRPEFSDDKENDGKSVISCKSMAKDGRDTQSQISRAPPSKVMSVKFVEAPAPAQTTSAGMVGGTVTEARSASVVRTLVQTVSGALPAPPPRPSEGGDSNAILGTLLGVAAGAALHYAFTKEKESNAQAPANVPVLAAPPTQYPSYGGAPEVAQYLALEDNVYTSTIRPAGGGSTTTSHRNGGGGQTIYSTGFGIGAPTAGSVASHASRLTSTPKMIEAAPASTIFRPVDPSPLSQAVSPPYGKAASRPPTARCASELSIAREQPAPSTASTTTTQRTKTKTTTRNVLRTTSDSELQHHHHHHHHHHTRPPLPTYPSQSATTNMPRARPSPLSEANLAVAAAAAAQSSPPPVTCATASLHSRNFEPDAYPLNLPSGRKSSKEPSSRVVGNSRGVGSGGCGTSTSTSTSTRKSKMALEVTPADSVSQVSSVRSASTVKAGSGGRSRR